MSNNILVLIVLCILLGAVFLFLQKKKKVNYFLFTVIASLVFAVFLYQEYLFGNAMFLYSTADGFSQYLPKYMEYVQSFREWQFPWWSLSIGFGSVQTYDVLLYPLNLIPVLAGAAGGELALQIAFAWMQVIKIVLAAVFMYLFLRKLNFDEFVVSCGSLLYAFCGIIILRGHWVFLADECYIAALILYAAELFFKENKWYLIPVSVFLLGCCLGIYYAYLYALLLIIYATIRYFFDGRKGKKYLRFLLICGGLFVLGLLIWGVVLVGSSWTMFTTARFESTGESVSGALREYLANRDILISALFSMFDPSATGAFDLYTGALNYLERPLFYCGIACLYFIVQAVILAEKRVRKLILFGIACAGVYLVATPVTDIFNAFIRNEELGVRSYRLSSLWIVIMMIVIAMYGLQCGLQKKSFAKTPLFVSGLSLISVFLFCLITAGGFGIHLNLSACFWCMVFLIGWLVFLLLLGETKENINYVRYWMAILLAVLCFEVCNASTETLNRSADVAKEQYNLMQEDLCGYYGDAADVADFLHAYDEGLYRVAGIRPVTGVATFCIPQYLDICDSSYYIPIDGGTYRFLDEVYPESFINGIGSKYSEGVGSNLLLSTLTGYKFCVVRNTVEYALPKGYQKIATIGNLDVLENMNALSFGLTYERYISESEFVKYDNETKRRLLLSCVVVPDEIAAELPLQQEDRVEYFSTADFFTVYNDNAAQLSREDMQITSWRDDRISGNVTVSKEKVLTISIPNVQGWKVYVDGEKAESFTTNLGFIGVLLEEGTHEIELCYTLPSMLVGLAVSVVALAAYVVMVINRKKITAFLANGSRT